MDAERETRARGRGMSGVIVLCMVEVFLEPLRIVLLIRPLSWFLNFLLGDFDKWREVLVGLCGEFSQF